MISVIQRVRKASVSVDGHVVGSIDGGMMILAAVEKGDDESLIERCARKLVSLRIFPDEEGRMNRSIEESGGSILAVSQFTLAGSIRKGRRPSFENAEEPERARTLFDLFVRTLRSEGIHVETGEFGAMMIVSLENDGPVTFVLRLPE
ncbi:MAG: D-tyrosyl-tRNA(Tyr) deacylase [Acidobacteria bacterium]|nr:D-tyrosyl-tRNA(Tyr) deacylase [Acidobacteriota bacterium]